MSGSINKVILVGNVGRDPEIRYTGDGSKVASFSLATGESWKDKNTGERRDRTEWHKIVVFNEKLVEVIEKYIKKGAKLFLEGQLQTRKWTDQQGVEKYTTEVVLPRYRGELTMLDGKSDGGVSGQENTYVEDNATSSFGNHNNSFTPQNNLDDEIPF